MMNDLLVLGGAFIFFSGIASVWRSYPLVGSGLCVSAVCLASLGLG